MKLPIIWITRLANVNILTEAWRQAWGSKKREILIFPRKTLKSSCFFQIHSLVPHLSPSLCAPAIHVCAFRYGYHSHTQLHSIAFAFDSATAPKRVSSGALWEIPCRNLAGTCRIACELEPRIWGSSLEPRVSRFSGNRQIETKTAINR